MNDNGSNNKRPTLAQKIIAEARHLSFKFKVVFFYYHTNSNGF
jgi:hypothetical protein